MKLTWIFMAGSVALFSASLAEAGDVAGVGADKPVILLAQADKREFRVDRERGEHRRDHRADRRDHRRDHHADRRDDRRDHHRDHRADRRDHRRDHHNDNLRHRRDNHHHGHRNHHWDHKHVHTRYCGHNYSRHHGHSWYGRNNDYAGYIAGGIILGTIFHHAAHDHGYSYYTTNRWGECFRVSVSHGRETYSEVPSYKCN